MNRFLRFTYTKIFLTIGLVLWQLIYNFQMVAYFEFSALGVYLKDGLSFINWDNYFLRKFSFLILWISVAILIFAAVCVYELVSTYSFNKKVEKKFTNKPKEDYEHLLRKTGVDFWGRFYPKLYRIASIGLVIFSMFSLSAIFENLRIYVLDMLIADLEMNNQNFNSYFILTLSFIFVVPLWYLVSSGFAWLTEKGEAEEAEEAVAEEHFAVKVEPTPKEEVEE